MTFVRSVLVLEDTHKRVDWLRATFPALDVVHVTNVVDFLKARRVPHAMVILDHDLGGPDQLSAEQYDRGESVDAHGLNGMDAVHACDRLTPTLVWSANPVCGPRMRAALGDMGVPVVYYPFRADVNMAAIITETYFTATGVWVPHEIPVCLT